MNDFFLIIPAFEPDHTLLDFLKSMKEYTGEEGLPAPRILVVDDGSSEKCREIFQEAQAYGRVLRHEKNRGKGAALRTAFFYIQEGHGLGYMVTADADGQHVWRDVKRVAAEARDHPGALVTGVRDFVGRVPLRSRLGNRITRGVFSLTTGTALRDTQCGLRGFSTELLPFLLSIEGDRYEYEMKMLTQAAGTIPILQVPIQTIYLEDNASSHFHVLRDSFLIYKDLLAFALSSFGAFVLDYGAYALLAALFALGGSTLGLFFANLAARVFSGTVNYHVNARWVFKDRPRERGSAWKYFGLALGIFSINSILLLLLHHWRVANVYWIKLMAECILFFASFVVQKRFVFRNKRRENVMDQKKFHGGKPYRYAAVFSALLMGLNSYALLKTFVLPDVQTQVMAQTAAESRQETVRESAAASSRSSIGSYKGAGNASASAAGNSSMQTETTQSSGTGSLEAGSGASSYQDDKISITLHTLRENNSTVYAAEVTVSDSALLKTALAQEAFGTNVVQRTSEIAQNHQAILAINGDYYGANSRGYVIKNGVIYRSSALRDSSQEDLAIFSDGSVKIIKESEVSAQELLDQGVVNLLSFGPVLVENGEITVSENDEVARSMASNPRTAIGFIDENHYIFLVSDGRTSESQGLSLYQLAQVMQSFGVKTAYNLDGGGSSTMYFNGNVVNQPTTSGWNIEEREVSDIVYIGY